MKKILSLVIGLIVSATVAQARLAGDIDDNGLVEFDDVMFLFSYTSAFFKPTDLASYKTRADSVVSGLGNPATLPTTQGEDFDGNGVIEFDDVMFLFSFTSAFFKPTDLVAFKTRADSVVSGLGTPTLLPGTDLGSGSAGLGCSVPVSVSLTGGSSSVVVGAPPSVGTITLAGEASNVSLSNGTLSWDAGSNTVGYAILECSNSTTGFTETTASTTLTSLSNASDSKSYLIISYNEPTVDVFGSSSCATFNGTIRCFGSSVTFNN